MATDSFRITGGQIYRLDLPLLNPLRWGKSHALTQLNHVLVELKGAEHSGFAEAVPRPMILDETQESVITFLHKTLPKADFELTRETIDSFSTKMFSEQGNLTAKAALNCAMYELLAAQEKRPLSRLLGLEEKGVQVCSIVTQHQDTEGFMKEITQGMDNGISGFKVKLTGRQERDTPILKAIATFTECRF